MQAVQQQQHPVLAPGLMLTPNLRLLRLIGRGGMGSVWLAEHLVLGSEVAVKVLSAELAHEPEALERFRREATAVAQLRSPNVVAIHDFGATATGIPYFVMEHLVGEDLALRLDRKGALPMGIVTAIVVQTCKALARAHDEGIVHRDLKPGNIFLTTVDGDLVVKLLDFGIAKVWSAQPHAEVSSNTSALHQTSDQSVLGTPKYMSPEQVLSPRRVGFRSDLYSLAVVIYECLVGRTPFEGETVGALHVAIANGRYTPICGVDPSLPLALDAWFARAFATEPNERFASAREMSDAFLKVTQFSVDSIPVALPSSSEPFLPAASTSSLAPIRLHTPVPFHPPVTPPPSPALAGLLPFVSGALAVLVLVAGILGAAHLTRRASAAEPAPTATTTAEPAPTTATATPAPSASTPSSITTAPKVSEPEPDPAPAPSSAPTAHAKPARTTNALPLPPTPKNAGDKTDKSDKPRRKNRGF
jgi:eukaryotic-like serine/threonine-protein kinase